MYTPRYEGPRWAIVTGSCEGFAVEELQRIVQAQVPYVVAVRREPGPESNVIALRPGEGQGYTISRTGSRIEISGNVLHGVADFARRAHPLESPDFRIVESPAVPHRGVWTWGYVIYDYRRFLDAMARLRMNTLTIWNDEPPVNARAVVEYAHSRGVRVIFGFHWGWGLKLDLSSADDRRTLKAEVLRNYRENYRHLGADGIYFQTLTEHAERTRSGRSIAAWACDWVNDIARGLLEENPGLRIEFGLHATSILEHYRDLEPLDERVTIVWEDAGVIPYSYNPVTDYADAGFAKPEGLGSPEATLAYSKKLAAMRPEFAIVAKGWITLNWEDEFEHHGPFLLGERDPEWIRRRLQQRQARWDFVNRLWEANAPIAAKFYREVRPSSVSGLIEDGMLEERIQPSVRRFADMLWDPRR